MFRTCVISVVIAMVMARCLSAASPADVVVASTANKSVDNGTYISANRIFMFVTNHGNWGRDLSGLFGYDGGTFYPFTTVGDIQGGTNTSQVQYAAGLWIGAIDSATGEIRVTVSEYSDEYVPGPMIDGGSSPDDPSFRVYKLHSDSLNGNPNDDFTNWPTADGAPTDSLGNPVMLGDQMTWSVFNDADPVEHTNGAGETDPLGVEVRHTTFAWDRDDQFGDVVFLRWRIYNYGGNTLQNCHISLWVDPDLGGYTDDLVGCDTLRDVVFCYNGDNDDTVYGSAPPSIGYALLQGPLAYTGNLVDTGLMWGQKYPQYANMDMTAFVKFTDENDPDDFNQTYNLMHGLTMLGDPYVYEGDTLKYWHSGDPVTQSGDLDFNPADRRMLLTAGPITLRPGDSTELLAAIVVGQGEDRLSSVYELRQLTDLAQAVYIEGFDLASLAPRVIAVIPALNRLTESYNPPIHVTFDSNIDEGTVNDTTFFAYGSLSGGHTGTIEDDTLDNTLTFNADQVFSAGEVVTVCLTDGITSSGGTPIRPFSWQFTIASASAPALFTGFDAWGGLYTTCIHVADVDKNGFPDVIAADQSGAEVLYNGGAELPDSVVRVSSGYNSGSVASADFNHDGWLDLIVGREQGIDLILNDGMGGFIDDTVLNDAGDYSHTVVTAGDLDGDGWVDIIASDDDVDVILMLNNRQGSFVPWDTLDTYWSDQADIEVGDLNNDGRMDIVTSASYYALTVFIRSGSSYSRTDYSIGECKDIELADLDADGFTDIVITAWGSGGVILFYNDRAGGFAEGISFSDQLDSYSVARGDLDGDGCLDLVMDSTYVLNDESETSCGVFSEPLEYPKSPNGFELSSDAIVVADMDGDSQLDIITAGWVDEGIRVYRNRPVPQITTLVPKMFDLANPTTEPVRIAFDMPIAENSLNTGTVELFGFSSGVIDGELTLESSGQEIVFAPWSELSSGEQFSVVLREGLMSADSVPFGRRFNYEFTTAVADSTGQFAPPTMSAVGIQAHSVIATDLDWDGDVDLAVVSMGDNTLSIFKNTGDGAFAAPMTYTTGTAPLAVASGDFNNDRMLDLVACNAGSDNISVFYNDQGGGFGLGELYSMGDNPRWVIARDLNLDGYDDIVTANASDNTISIRFSNGGGMFGYEHSYTVGNSPWFVTAADVDADGYPDLITANTGGGASVLLNRGNGQFEDHIENYAGTFSRSICAVNLNDDGQIDLVTADADVDSISVLPGMGGAIFGVPIHFATGNRPVYVESADIDGDGDHDIIVACDSSNALVIHWNDGAGDLSDTTMISCGTGPHAVSCADIDQDRDLDLAAVNFGSGDLYIYKNLSTVAELWYVSTNGSDSSGDGSQGLPFATIQHAINQAKSGDWVLVGPGTYSGYGNRDIDFGGKNLTVQSTDGPDNTTLDLFDADSVLHRGLYFHMGEDSTSIVDGFKIENGYAFNGPNTYGGGIYCDGASPTIRNCVFDHDEAVFGGGIACRNGAAPKVSYCTFYMCWGNAGGGGVWCQDAGEVTIANSVISHCLGEAVYVEAGTVPKLSCCNLFGNSSDWSGLIADQYGANGNISADPRYCSPTNSDFHVSPISPCSPANNDCQDRIGALGVGCAVAANEIRMYYPVPGQQIFAPRSDTIRWIRGEDVSSELCVQLSRDGGASWGTPVIADTDTTFLWNISGPLTHNALLCVYDTSNLEMADTMDGTFVIDSIPVVPCTAWYCPKNNIRATTSGGGKGEFDALKTLGSGSMDDLITFSYDGFVELFSGVEGVGYDSIGQIMIQTDPGLVDMAISDFNRDGLLDIALANELTQQVQIYYNSGSTVFPITPSDTILMTSTPMDIGQADFDRDGWDDIWILSRGPGKLDVYVNESGQFDAIAGCSVSVPDVPRCGVTCYLDADQYLDLAVAAGTESCIVLEYHGLGDGCFDVSPRTTIGPGFSAPSGIVAGDFNEDGLTDLGTTFSGSAAVFRTYVQRYSVDSNWVEIRDYDTWYGQHSSVALGDFTSDGTVDVAISCEANDSLVVLPGIPVTFQDTVMFARPLTFGSGSGPVDLLVEDVNFDGLPDLLSLNPSSEDVTTLISQLSPYLPLDVQVLSPNGGQMWPVGSSQTIEWFRGDGIIAITIELTRDNGATWQTLATDLTGSQFEWLVSGPGTINALIRISDATVSSRYDASDAEFIVHDDCCIIRGDIDNSGDGPDISDLILLVTYMFQGGPEPFCLETTNANGVDGPAPDISDLIHLVDYMFQNGPPLVPCE